MPAGTDPPLAAGRTKLRVGDWTVEPALNQLSIAGKTVRLEPKVMAVLVYFADRPGLVVRREDMLAAAWPGVLVGDDSLTQAVIKLRKALGDVPEKPTYIQTISKGGYRLIAPVVRPATLPPIHNRPQGEHVHVGRRPRLPWIAATGLAALLISAAGVWWIKSGPEESVRSEQEALTITDAARAELPTVAIRSFAALGNDPQAQLLAQGIAADLVTDLAKVSGLSVIGATLTGGEAGAAPARYLVSGSVQRVDQRLRLHVHLTDARSGNQLWAERFDRPLNNLFAIQEELAPKILQTLPAKVSEAEMRRVAQRHTRNLEAYENYQRGRAALLVRQRAENETAREMFQRAIGLDAAFARAYAGLALTYAAEYRNQWTRNRAATVERAFELARTANEMNPDIPETHWVLAFVHLERRQHDEALQHLETAVRLYPSFADGYALMGGVYTYIGRPADTVRWLRAAMRLNPQAGHLYFLLLGRAYLFLGDLEQARVNLEHALSRNAANLEAHVYMAALQVAAGDRAAADWEAEEIRALQPDFSSRAWLETYPMTDGAQKAKLVQALGELGF